MGGLGRRPGGKRGKERKKEGINPCSIPDSNTRKHGNFLTVEVLIVDDGGTGSLLVFLLILFETPKKLAANLASKE